MRGSLMATWQAASSWSWYLKSKTKMNVEIGVQPWRKCNVNWINKPSLLYGNGRWRKSEMYMGWFLVRLPHVATWAVWYTANLRMWFAWTIVYRVPYRSEQQGKDAFPRQVLMWLAIHLSIKGTRRLLQAMNSSIVQRAVECPIFGNACLLHKQWVLTK